MPTCRSSKRRRWSGRVTPLVVLLVLHRLQLGPGVVGLAGVVAAGGPPGGGPRLELPDLRPSAVGGGVDVVAAGVMDAVDRAERHAEPAVDALLQYDGEAAGEVTLDLVDGVDL